MAASEAHVKEGFFLRIQIDMRACMFVCRKRMTSRTTLNITQGMNRPPQKPGQLMNLDGSNYFF